MGQWKAIHVAVFNHKGGVGKSTLSALLARDLARTNHVLLVDLDAQTSSSGAALGVDVNTGLRYSVADFLDGKGPVSTLVPPHITGRQLQVIPITKSVGRDIQERLVKRRHHFQAAGSTGPGIYGVLDKRFAEHMDHKFHFIFMDCPPTALSELMMNALAAADVVLVPVELHQLSLGSVTDTQEELLRVPRQGRMVKYVANKVEANRIEQREAISQLSDLVGDELLSVSLPKNEAFPRATSLMQPIHRMSRYPEAINALQNVAGLFVRLLDERYVALGCDRTDVENQIRAAQALEQE